MCSETFIQDSIDPSPDFFRHSALIKKVHCVLRTEMAVGAQWIRKILILESTSRLLLLDIGPESSK